MQAHQARHCCDSSQKQRKQGLAETVTAAVNCCNTLPTQSRSTLMSLQGDNPPCKNFSERGVLSKAVAAVSGDTQVCPSSMQQGKTLRGEL